ncbi:hypothetical protein [Streptomyces luteireticuli]|uniref:Transposase n=1 Tax=Streptomyces luteireticuli TaxID=173858 RepID=A0ABP3IJ25_9ACTN
MAKTKLVLTRGWEYEVLRSPGVRRAVARTTATVAAHAVADAPQWPVQEHWNRIRNHISTVITLDRWGWRGAVVTEVNPKVRHAMLLERGWKDRAGRRHEGRRYLKGALLKARVE